jgi:hypothetical protein
MTVRSASDTEGPAASREPAGSVRDLCEAIWEAEERFGLLDWQLRGIFAWQALRFPTYYQLAREAGLFESAATPPPRGLRARGSHILGLFEGSVTGNPFLGDRTVDALVFESGRSKPVDGKRVNIHTHFLLEQLEQDGKSAQIITSRFDGAHDKSPDPRRTYADAIALATLVGQKLRPPRLTTAELAEIGSVEQQLESTCGVRVDLRTACTRLVSDFWIRHALYSRLLRRRRPQDVYCVAAYAGFAPLVAAARDLGVRVNEIQHGIITRYHMGYSYPVLPASGQLAYFPDRLLTWGGDWDRWMDLPDRCTELVPFRYGYFEHLRRKYLGVARQPGKTVVLSQGVLGRRMAELLLEHWEQLRDLKIVFKLHPTEYQRWKSYDSLVSLARKPNVEVVDHVDLFQLLAESEFQIGVFSTALYEGLAFGCKTVLLPLPGIEYMEAVLEAGEAVDFQAFLAARQPG